MSGGQRALPLSNWPLVPLGTICDMVMGQSPDGASYNSTGEGEPLLNGPTEFGPRHPIPVQWTTSPTQFAEAGDILFCVRGATTGKKNIADQRYCIGRGLAAIRGNAQIVTTEYLYFVLEYLTKALVRESSGSTFPNLPREKIEQFRVPLPPLSQQQAIVRQLERDMAEVERLRVASEHQWDAIAKLPQASLRQVFEDEDAHNWLHVPLDEVCSIVEGQVDPRLPEYRGLPHINGEVIETGTGRLLNYRTVGEDRVTSGKYYFNAGSVIYSKLRPYLRKVVLVDFQGLCSADAYPITTNPQFLSPLWLKWSLLTDTFTAYASEESLRSRMPKLNREQLLSWRIPLPDMPTQNRIAKQLEGNLEGVVTMRRHAERQRAAIEALPGALLGEVFGEAAP
jgi:type I restriction enzyme, S subunit